MKTPARACLVTILTLTTATRAASPPIFTIETPADLTTSDGSLDAAAAISPTDAWAVGTTIAHFDGELWQIIAKPENRGTLADVSAPATDDVWAVGQTGGLTPQPLVEQWNGTSWQVVPPPQQTSETLTTTVAFSADDVWVGGYYINDPNIAPLFEHWNGQTWQQSLSPFAGTYAFIKKISATSPTDIWAVGYLSGTLNQPLIEHYDGTSWQIVKPATAGTGGQLFGVVAIAPNDSWAVGNFTLKAIKVAEDSFVPVQTLTEHWDGTAWTVIPSPNIGPTSAEQVNRLAAVTALSSSDVWAAGDFELPDGTVAPLTLAMHWNGTAWSLQPTPDIASLSSLAGAATAAPSTVWFVGAGASPGIISQAPLIAGTTGG